MTDADLSEQNAEEQYTPGRAPSGFLHFKGFVEGRFGQFVVDEYCRHIQEEDCHTCTQIKVQEPFVPKKQRAKYYNPDDRESSVHPEICVRIGNSVTLGECAAWKDSSGSKDYTYAHQAVARIEGLTTGLPRYIAQKVMCQIFPAVYFFEDREANQLAFRCFLGVTKNHNKEHKVEDALSALKREGLIKDSRFYFDNNEDIERYGQLIFEIEFPEDLEGVKNWLKAHGAS